MGLDLEKAEATLRECKTLPEATMKRLCTVVTNILMESPNIVPVKAPVTVCGDIHGQFFDLLELFRIGGELPEKSYIFLGDFVDRGYHSVETWSYLMLMKARYPSRITLLRGNHESRQVTRAYGFYDEIMRKYGDPSVYRHCTDVFDVLPIGAMVNGRVFCVHGGLSPDVGAIDHLRMVERKQEIPHMGAFCDIMWSDPDDFGDLWSVSPRGAGWLFGRRITQEFNRINGLQLICRAHQLAQEGHSRHHEDALITVWSAPNYVYRCGNVASILRLDEKLNQELETFTDTEKSRQSAKQPRPPAYFL